MRVTHPMLLYGRTQNEAPSLECEAAGIDLFGKAAANQNIIILLYLFEVSNKLYYEKRLMY